MTAQAPQIQTTFTAGQALSPAIPLGNQSIVGILVPSNWTTAGITLQASIDDTNFVELVDQTNTAIGCSSITGGTAVLVAVDPTKLRGVQNIKIRSGTAGAPVNQTMPWYSRC